MQEEKTILENDRQEIIRLFAQAKIEAAKYFLSKYMDEKVNTSNPLLNTYYMLRAFVKNSGSAEKKEKYYKEELEPVVNKFLERSFHKDEDILMAEQICSQYGSEDRKIIISSFKKELEELDDIPSLTGISKQDLWGAWLAGTDLLGKETQVPKQKDKGKGMGEEEAYRGMGL